MAFQLVAAAFHELGAHSVAWCFRRDHDHVEVGTRNNLIVVNRETVGESQGGAFLDIRLDFVLVQRRLELVRGQNHDHVSRGHRASNVSDFQAVCFSFGDSGRTFTQTDSHVYT